MAQNALSGEARALGLDPSGPAIGRQIKLSWAKAFEISFKSVKIRFTRSLITAGGIVLAIAFLMATWTRGGVTASLKSALPAQIKKAQEGLIPLQELKSRARALPVAGRWMEEASKALKEFDNKDTGVLALNKALTSLDSQVVLHPELKGDAWANWKGHRAALAQFTDDAGMEGLAAGTATWPQLPEDLAKALKAGNAGEAVRLLNAELKGQGKLAPVDEALKKNDIPGALKALEPLLLKKKKGPLDPIKEALDAGNAAEAQRLVDENQKAVAALKPRFTELRDALLGLKFKFLVDLIAKAEKFPKSLEEVTRAMKAATPLAAAEAADAQLAKLPELAPVKQALQAGNAAEALRLVEEELKRKPDLAAIKRALRAGDLPEALRLTDIEMKAAADFRNTPALKEVREGLATLAGYHFDKEGFLRLRQEIEKVSGTARFLYNVNEELNRGNVRGAWTGLQNALERRPDLADEPSIAALRTGLEPLLAVHDRLQKLQAMRLQLVKRGEVLDEEGEGAAAGSSDSSRNIWLVALALLVALVGITNAMLMSVTERFREIGTMKCLGALNSFIVKLFLIESSLQGFLGTLLGVLLGLFLSLLSLWSDFGGATVDFIPWGLLGGRILIALAIGTGLAFLGALLPALVAARMEPVVAMRVDQ